MAITNGSVYKGLALGINGITVRPGWTTAALTTGLTKGDLMIGFSGSVPRIGICSSTAAQTVKYIRTRSKSFASATA